MRNKITIKEPNNWVPAQDMKVNQFGIVRQMNKSTLSDYVGKIIAREWSGCFILLDDFNITWPSDSLTKTKVELIPEGAEINIIVGSPTVE